MKGIGEILSKEQMKNVVGGNYGTCSVSVTCWDSAVISCSGNNGNCHYEHSDAVKRGGWVQCDNDPKVHCAA